MVTVPSRAKQKQCSDAGAILPIGEMTPRSNNAERNADNLDKYQGKCYVLYAAFNSSGYIERA